jgi:hypothetical protein
MISDSSTNDFIKLESDDSARAGFFPRWLKSEKAVLVALLVLAVLTWLPRLKGPIDLRWDGGVYYILGTSLAEGKGYKLLNEPGEIDAVQYPPLLPLIIAGHQLILGTNDPTTVGGWLRVSAFVIFIFYVFAVFRLFKIYLSLHYAFIATILCLFSTHVYFLSDLCFPEILFSLTTILFFLCNRKEDSRAYSVATYFFAVAAYALRTVGLAVFAAWILESLIKKRFKQAILRLILVLIPVFCWQFYIASVESSYEYNHPAYSYQRAPYMFYNVSYARNISLDDPFTPEKGEAQVVWRFVGNLSQLPFYLGESASTLNYYWAEELMRPFNVAKTTLLSISRLGAIILYIVGLAVLIGLVLQLFQGRRIIPLYVFIYVSAVCLTPFPQQYTRYLMPITVFLVLSLIVFLMTVKDAAIHRLSAKWFDLGNCFVVGALLLILLFQLVTFKHIYFNLLEPIEYFDRNGKLVKHRMFFENDSFQGFNLCIDYISRNAQSNDVVAAGTPHWIYLRTGLKAVIPPFENDSARAQQLLDSVPVTYLIVGRDVIGGERYTVPVVEQFTEEWKRVFTAPESDWAVYERVNR